MISPDKLRVLKSPAFWIGIVVIAVACNLIIRDTSLSLLLSLTFGGVWALTFDLLPWFKNK
jgi:hypothetical protein